jgi:hypothetical protein
MYFEERPYPFCVIQTTHLRHLSTVRQNRYFRKRYLSYFIGRTKLVIQNKELGQNNLILISCTCLTMFKTDLHYDKTKL